MKNTSGVSIVVAGLLGAGLLAAAPTTAAAQTAKVAPAEYAKAVCAALGPTKSADEALFAQYGRNPSMFGSQQEAVDTAAGYQQIWQVAAAALETPAPKVRNGKKIQKVFVDYATKAADKIQAVIDAFKAIDPASAQYMTAVRQFGHTAFVNIRPSLGDPLKNVTDRSVRKAFKREEACAGLFASLPSRSG